MKQPLPLLRLSACILMLLVALVITFAQPVSPTYARSGSSQPVMQHAATQPPALAPTKTALPAEYVYNGEQTNSIILASAVLVLIVVFAVLGFTPKNEKK